MSCRDFEGQLLRKKWNGWRKCWILLRRGTLSVHEKRTNLPIEPKTPTMKRKAVHHFYHLDLANLTTGKNPSGIKLRFQSGEVLKFRVPGTSGELYREEWMALFREHINYANRCMGVSSSILGPAESDSMLVSLAKNSKERMDVLQQSLLAFHTAVRERQARIDSGVVESLHDVAGAAERAQKSMKEFYDAVLQENLFRAEELAKEQDRAELAEDTLDIVAKKYNTMLINIDRSQSGRSMSSEYFTPEGSLRGFSEEFHSDEELSLVNHEPETIAFEKDNTALMARANLRDDIDQVLRGLDAAAKRRQTPRLASFGPMSIAGSSYEDVSRASRFEDCISLDTRSFIISNGDLSSRGIDSDVSKSSHYTDARSSFASDAQSFKSAVSDVRSP
ncbi:hypothetical protein BV898_06949 [Hypsibius exemplaris]|uniref:PH domain-containing protein n=1 Tax=Hypsibius exemplaris TaxID=2072580 RepID=A0A1W0WV73_HYPEX|nr:hypothetical protein BV898_06949 [Hypsibius exemplaris]